jgi:hypothetical protein
MDHDSGPGDREVPNATRKNYIAFGVIMSNICEHGFPPG